MVGPIPRDVVRIQLRYEWGTEIAVNTFHLHVDGPTSNWGNMTQKTADKVRDVWAANWANIGNMMTSSAKIVRVDAYHLADDTGLTLDKRTALFAGGGLAGSAGAMLPPEVALAVSLYGYDPAVYDPQGARKRGRIYLPFVGQNQSNDNGLVNNPVGVARLLRIALSQLNGVEISGISTDNPGGSIHANPVVLSRKYGTMQGIVAVRCDNLFDMQKRRQNNLLVVPAFDRLTAA